MGQVDIVTKHSEVNFSSNAEWLLNSGIGK